MYKFFNKIIIIVYLLSLLNMIRLISFDTLIYIIDSLHTSVKLTLPSLYFMFTHMFGLISSNELNWILPIISNADEPLKLSNNFYMNPEVSNQTTSENIDPIIEGEDTDSDWSSSGSERDLSISEDLIVSKEEVSRFIPFQQSEQEREQEINSWEEESMSDSLPPRLVTDSNERVHVFIKELIYKYLSDVINSKLQSTNVSVLQPVSSESSDFDNNLQIDVSSVVEPTKTQIKNDIDYLQFFQWTLFGIALSATLYLALDFYCDYSIGKSAWDFFKDQPKSIPVKSLSIDTVREIEKSLGKHIIDDAAEVVNNKIMYNYKNIPAYIIYGNDIFDTVDYHTPSINDKIIKDYNPTILVMSTDTCKIEDSIRPEAYEEVKYEGDSSNPYDPVIQTVDKHQIVVENSCGILNEDNETIKNLNIK